MSNKILSIDMRDDAISALLITSGVKGNRIQSYCHIRFDQAPRDTENTLFWAIGQIAGSIDKAGATCILSVSPSEVIYRNVKVPFKERKKIAQMLPFELESSLPRAVEELIIDFDIVRKSDYTDLIAAAVETEKNNEIVAALKAFDITPRYITAGFIPEAMCFARLGIAKAEDFLFIGIDDTCATMCIMFSGKLHLARTFKMPRGGAGQRIDRLKKEILRILAAFETVYDFDFQCRQIMISCSSSFGETKKDVDDFAGKLKDVLEVDVKIVNLFEDANLKILSYPKDGTFDPRLFSPALGLAGIEIDRVTPFNFSRDHNFFYKYWMENKVELIATGALGFFVFMLVMVNAIIHVRFLENQVRKLDNEIIDIFRSTLQEQTRVVDPLHQMKTEIEKIRGKSALSQTLGADISNVEMLNQISKLIPDGIDLIITNLVRSDDHVSLSGNLKNFNEVEEVKDHLEKIDFFEKITISSANMDNTINRVRFRIRADFSG